MPLVISNITVCFEALVSETVKDKLRSYGDLGGNYLKNIKLQLQMWMPSIKGERVATDKTTIQ
jgi:hypothetical protein